MTVKNLTMTLEEGRIRTWRLPAFSALLIAFKQSLRTEVLTILAVVQGDSRWRGATEVSAGKMRLASRCRSVESALSLLRRDQRVLQLVSQRRHSVALILAGGCDCISWLSEGHSWAAETYLVRVRVWCGEGEGKVRQELSILRGWPSVRLARPWRWVLACRRASETRAALLDLDHHHATIISEREENNGCLVHLQALLYCLCGCFISKVVTSSSRLHVRSRITNGHDVLPLAFVLRLPQSSPHAASPSDFLLLFP